MVQGRRRADQDQAFSRWQFRELAYENYNLLVQMTHVVGATRLAQAEAAFFTERSATRFFPHHTQQSGAFFPSLANMGHSCVGALAG